MKYYGKEKCRILKEIRAEIARQNDIEWVVSECKHKGNCKGTCPKCEQEVRQLEDALAKREALGKTVAVVGISASIALSVTGCVNPFPQPTDGVPMGDVMPPETEDQTACDTAIQGVEIQTEQGELIVPGEEPETTAEWEDELMGEPTEEMTEEPLMGDVAIEGEFIEEITEEATETDTVEENFEDELMGAPVEMPTETDPESEEEPLMGAPVE